MLNKQIEDFNESIQILQDSIELFKEGKKYQYRNIAIQLRALLCDKNALFHKMFPDELFSETHTERLWRLTNHILNEQKTVLFSGSIINIGSNNKANIFNRKKQCLKLDKWLDQKIIRIENIWISIRDIVKGAADKSGAHFDIKFSDQIQKTKRLCFGVEESHLTLLLGLGEYILAKMLKRKKYILNKDYIKDL